MAATAVGVLGSAIVTAHPNTLHPDTVVEGKYRIKRLLAEGGMGAVYHAVQEPLGRDVALKILKPQDDTPQKREQRERRFFREAAVSGRLNHPNTIVIVDYGKLPDSDGYFLVMEYLDGISLRQLLNERGALGTRLTLHIAMQIAASLADAHRAGAVHRDLKPPNVMLVPRGDDPYFVKVVDFGLVKQLDPEEGEDELTSENALVGSPRYMAPERFLSASADSPAADVYSLGIVMYEMLTGRTPFVREGDSTLQSIMLQHIQTDPPPMRAVRSDLELPPGLEELVMACLAKHPDDRIPSMDVLLTHLRVCAAGAGMGVAVPVEDTGAFVRPAAPLNLVDSAPTVLGPREPLPDAPAETPAPLETSPDKPGRTALTLGLVALAGLLVAAVLAVTLSGQSPSPTHLVVNSAPSGASVRIDTQTLGQTPFDGPVDVEAATTLRVEKDGFDVFEYRFLPRPGESVVVDARLAPTAPPPATEPVREPETVDAGAPPPPPDERPDAGEVTPKPVETKPKTRPKPKPKPTEPAPDIKLNR